MPLKFLSVDSSFSAVSAIAAYFASVAQSVPDGPPTEVAPENRTIV